MKFIADDMLGRLAKWLRIIGYDTYYCPPISDAEILRKAASENRIILTRDTHLLERELSGNCVFIQSDYLREQLRQVVEELKLDTNTHLLTRCPVCNTEITLIEKEEARGKVPPFVFETHQEFARCPRCGRIYWKGTHYKRIIKTLSQI